MSTSGTPLAETARHLCMAREQVRRLVAQGVLERRADGGFDLDLCRARYIEHLRGRAAQSAHQRDRLSEARARAIELRTAREQASLVPTKESLDVISFITGRVVAVWERFPARIAPTDLELRRRAERVVFEGRTEVANLIAREAVRLEEAALKTARQRS